MSLSFLKPTPLKLGLLLTFLVAVFIHYWLITNLSGAMVGNNFFLHFMYNITSIFIIVPYYIAFITGVFKDILSSNAPFPQIFYNPIFLLYLVIYQYILASIFGSKGIYRFINSHINLRPKKLWFILLLVILILFAVG